MWKIDRYTFVSMVNIESQFYSMAVSNKGALGASQVLARVHKDKIRKRRIMKHEIFYLDNNYSLGCEIIYDAKKKSNNLNETLKLYVGGDYPEYYEAVRRGIAKCKAEESSTFIVSTTVKG
jgi:soluble lytic murein transglycosylase-like protein